MATIVVVFKILFLVLIAHSFVASSGSQQQTAPTTRQPASSSWPHQNYQTIGQNYKNGDEETAELITETPELPTTNDRQEDDTKHNSSSTTSRRRQERTASGGGSRMLPPPPPPPSSSLSFSNEISPSSEVPTGPTETLVEAHPLTSSRSSQQEDELIEDRQPATREQPANKVAVNYAELCYLSDGGSSITLTVNEATQVGSIIGMVEVSRSEKICITLYLSLSLNVQINWPTL